MNWNCNRTRILADAADVHGIGISLILIRDNPFKSGLFRVPLPLAFDFLFFGFLNLGRD